MSRGYYAIIPANVRYDKTLKANAKLLYGEITALCNEKGYCWASNSYFSELYQVKKETVSRWISQLSDKGYIRIELIYKEGTKQIINRYIRINHDPIDEKVIDPIDEKVKDNTTSNNTTDNIHDLFNHYLSKDIVKHKKLTSIMRTNIKARLRDYTVEELKKAIDNYDVVYKGNEYWFTHKYTLNDLMRAKDVGKFLDEADPLNNFRKNKSVVQAKKEVSATNEVIPDSVEITEDDYY